MAEPAQTSNQSRIGIEGRGGSKSPNLISRSSFRYVFVGGMVAAGNAHLCLVSFSDFYT